MHQQQQQQEEQLLFYLGPATLGVEPDISGQSWKRLHLHQVCQRGPVGPTPRGAQGRAVEPRGRTNVLHYRMQVVLDFLHQAVNYTQEPFAARLLCSKGHWHKDPLVFMVIST